MTKVEYGKMIDGVLEIAPKVAVFEDGTQQIPPSKSWLENAGYKPLEYTAMPDPKENYSYSFAWEEKDGKIVQVWSEEYIEPQYTEEDRLTAIESALLDIMEMLGGAE